MKQKPKTYEVPRNSGKSIILYVKVIRTIGAIISIGEIIGGIALSADTENVLGFFAGILAGAINYLFIYIITMVLRGFGELVENMARTTGAIEYLCAKNGGVARLELTEESSAQQGEVQNEGMPAEADETVDGAVYFEKTSNQNVKCPYCDTIQMRGQNYCKKCGVKFIYDIDEQP